MITELNLKNFKSIKSKKFQLRNLNVVIGMNGQGKSSFIQSLLLLRQSDIFEDQLLQLNLGNTGIINLGSAKDVLYQYAPEEESVSYSITFDNENLLEFSTTYNADSDILPIEYRNTNIDIALQSIVKEPLFTKRFQYLNAQRIEPSDENRASYTSVILNDDLGINGQYTAHYIDKFGDKPIAFDNLLHSNSFIKDEILEQDLIKSSLLEQINFWLGEISPKVSVKTKKITNSLVLLGYEFAQSGVGFTNEFAPQNVGFGISYSLHVITAILKARKGDLVIIENPESHIHPRGQAELGKLIALAAQNDVQIIIETHSDHIINGIRVAVKENNDLSDRVIMFYFEKLFNSDEQFSQITDINVDKNGSLDIYPKNFLSEWSNQLFKLM
ncbi:DUF3696 domain-containing protein [Chryseobacterium luquanense]|uniref:DUF3696 domain-containing protein n=1 Tax=Chryseobacterium luquanense TaxID=2983766 RepID=A0ABT3XY88_9FLAO|nr:DUF3696 domain-containing protein [Chryseobacterium luquanense]MCX8530860.1 DUF3696 domain-containing protein [Chryseobacterium luquanense]